MYQNSDDVMIGTNAFAGSTLGVYGNAAIGTAYSVLAAPSNGMIIEGNVGIGTTGTGYQIECKANCNTYANGIGINRAADDSGLYLYHNGTSSVIVSDYIITGAATPATNHHRC
jgi:hypothetical protein